MDGEADALALDDARIEDSVMCEGCGATFDVTEVVLSVFEEDDGGTYCAECAAKEWARTVEECSRLRDALQTIARLEPDHWQQAGLKRHVYAMRRLAIAALAPTAGEGDGDGN